MKTNNLHVWECHFMSAVINFKLQGAILGSRGPSLGPRWPLESKVGKTTSFHLGGTRSGGPLMSNFTTVTRASAAPGQLAARTVSCSQTNVAPDGFRKCTACRYPVCGNEAVSHAFGCEWIRFADRDVAPFAPWRLSP